MATNRRPHSLRLVEFSDRELLNIILDVEDETGWVDTFSVSEAMHLDHEHALQCVGSRFSWLRRYEILERQDDNTKEHFRMWRLTPIGRKIALGDLAPDERELLSKLSAEKLMLATGELTRRYHRIGAPAATMMRRAWINGTAPR